MARSTTTEMTSLTVAAITDTDGSAIERYAYTAYGVLTILPDGSSVRSSSSYANPYTFTGRRRNSETEPEYYRARHFDPAMGRFVSRDPFGYEDGSSLYQYVMSRPTMSLAIGTHLLFVIRQYQEVSISCREGGGFWQALLSRNLHQ